MNQTVSTEVLSQEVVDEAKQRVDAVLHGTGQGNGVTAVELAASQVNPTPASASAPSTAPAPTRQTTTRKNNGTAKGKSVNAIASDPNTRVISITLPKDVLDWYEQEAAEAPFEPSVQKYVAWELRELAKARQRERTAQQSAAEQQLGAQYQAAPRPGQ